MPQGVTVHFKSVLAASGNVPRAVFLKAAKLHEVPEEARRIGDSVLVMGYRQAAVAQQLGMSRQRVHTVCRDLLATINELLHSSKAPK
jgi:hypothetical protein